MKESADRVCPEATLVRLADYKKSCFLSQFQQIRHRKENHP
jgi:hypothetical protein